MTVVPARQLAMVGGRGVADLLVVDQGVLALGTWGWWLRMVVEDG
jgi:hypothetical protein